MVKARRIIVHTGSYVAVGEGPVYHFASQAHLSAWAMKQHKVFAFMDTNSLIQGTMRSSRAAGVRFIDRRVRNVVDSGLFIVDSEPIVKE
jgi:hypothetical protein